MYEFPHEGSAEHFHIWIAKVKNYNQLNSKQRYRIEALLQNEVTQEEIAKII